MVIFILFSHDKRSIAGRDNATPVHVKSGGLSPVRNPNKTGNAAPVSAAIGDTIDAIPVERPWNRTRTPNAPEIPPVIPHRRSYDVTELEPLKGLQQGL